MSRHFLDKPILRDLFWFVVLPHRAKEWLASKRTAEDAGGEHG